MYLVCDGKKISYGNAQELEALYYNNKPLFDTLYSRIWLDKGKKDEKEPKIHKILSEK